MSVFGRPAVTRLVLLRRRQSRQSRPIRRFRPNPTPAMAAVGARSSRWSFWRQPRSVHGERSRRHPRRIRRRLSPRPTSRWRWSRSPRVMRAEPHVARAGVRVTRLVVLVAALRPGWATSSDLRAPSACRTFARTAWLERHSETRRPRIQPRNPGKLRFGPGVGVRSSRDGQRAAAAQGSAQAL